MSEQKFYITTPIYYVNAPPHMGTGYTTIIADTLARYKRMTGFRVKMVTGSDEHSQNIADKAAAEGISPEEFCSRLIPDFQNAWKLLDIGDYGFYRTSSPEHRRVVQAFFQRSYDRGDIYKHDYSGWYHTTDNRFVDEDELPENPESHPYLKHLTEEAYWFRLSKYGDALLEFHEKNPEAVIPDFRRKEMLNRIKEGLRDLCISRSSTDWGIPLPWDEKHVFYVWVDALLTYLTGSGFDVPSAVQALQQGKDPMDVQPDGNFWPCDLHIMAKDIPWFHAVIWPATLMSVGIPCPRQILVHGYWNFEGTKMSKSRGNVFHPQDAVALVGSDGVRYFVLREVPIGLDGNFSVRALAERYNYDLANDFGNLLYRALTMAQKFRQGVVAKVPVPAENHRACEELRREVAEDVAELYGKLAFKDALERAWQLVRGLNRFIDEAQPWTIAKDPARAGELDSFFAVLFRSVRTLLVLLAPIMPRACNAMWRQIGLPGEATSQHFSSIHEELPDGHRVAQPEIVFPKLDLENLEDDFILRKEKMTGEKVERVAEQRENGGFINYEDFQRVRMITARVLRAEAVDGADKLLRLTLDDGQRRDRTIVSGIRPAFAPDDLEGKTICIVDNLKPRKIFGILSEGMLLAAGEGEHITLVTPAGDLAPGVRVG
ncbi:MAG: methionine--tRNA ligase [Armatimonadetes bacterium]|nr:methionine--tRNA ligase [Armatimonadota bacterium]